MNEIIRRHYAYSSDRLNAFIEEVNNIEALKGMEEFCISACGAYARHEANKNSGIDISFVSTAKAPSVSMASQILVNADLIRLVREQELSAFYDNGEFIRTSYLDEIIAMVATPRETADGLFDWRMHFLLESVAIFNTAIYEKALKAIITTYFEDYPQYTTEFPAVFLINDIIRFWKTNSLNKEHCRDFRRLSPNLNPWLHFENLKLAYSTKLTCYSVIIQLLARGDSLSVESILDIVKMKPLERILEIKGTGSDKDHLIDQIIEIYCKYLSLCEREPQWIEQYMADPESRNKIFSIARIDFGQKLFDLMSLLIRHKPEVFKYLII